jgi:dihydroorotase-like cyclic amidohydrolase
VDSVLRNARLASSAEGRLVDIGIDGGRIVALASGLAPAGETLDLGGRLAGAAASPSAM